MPDARRTHNIMKTKHLMVGLTMAGGLVLATGCVERRVVYVPANPPPPAYVYSTPPVATAPDITAPVPQPAVTVVAPAAPPAPQVEVMPVAPGPEYYWVTGCWNWNGATWVWIGGRWAPRPWHGAVWVAGHYARRSHGYVWVGGRWH
jgi:hypothetical protein